MAKIVMSAFKRAFGESLRILAQRAAFIEADAGAAARNRNPNIGDGAVREAANRQVQAYGAAAARSKSSTAQVWGETNSGSRPASALRSVPRRMQPALPKGPGSLGLESARRTARRS